MNMSPGQVKKKFKVRKTQTFQPSWVNVNVKNYNFNFKSATSACGRRSGCIVILVRLSALNGMVWVRVRAGDIALCSVGQGNLLGASLQNEAIASPNLFHTGRKNDNKEMIL